MKPVIIVALLIRVIFGFRTFDLVYILTRGGPGVSTDVMSYYIYRRTFMGLSLAESSAASFILLFVTMFIVVFLYRAMSMQREV
jgi:multiple sugar transport system permease protein